jgi:hypothetical protein
MHVYELVYVTFSLLSFSQNLLFSIFQSKHMEGQDTKVYFDVEKQALFVQPLNYYMNFVEEINDSITKQISVSNNFRVLFYLLISKS